MSYRYLILLIINNIMFFLKNRNFRFFLYSDRIHLLRRTMDLFDGYLYKTISFNQIIKNKWTTLYIVRVSSKLNGGPVQQTLLFARQKLVCRFYSCGLFYSVNMWRNKTVVMLNL